MESNIQVCWVETDSHSGKDKKLLHSCQLLGIEPMVFGRGEEWKGPPDKFHYFLDGILNTDIDKEYVLFVDSRDVLFYKGLNEIEKKFKDNYDCDLLFNGETNCYPNPLLAGDFPKQHKKYKYFNAGMCIGKLDFLREFLPKIKHNFMDYEKNWGDPDRLGSEQGAWVKVYFEQLEKYGDESPIQIDYDCHVFQCLWDQEWGRSANFDIVYNKDRIYNKLTNTEPCVFHMPGPTCVDGQVWKIINNTYHVKNAWNFE